VAVSEREQVVDDLPLFTRFYPATYDEVYRALALTLRDPELTADAVQEAYARALARWDEVSTYANPAGWVYRVALNWARSRIRRRGRELLTRHTPERAAPDLPPPADPEVARALRGLPVEQRAVVVLRLCLDWSVEEVAMALDVSPGTVKSRLSRALARLRDRLEVTT
jgi:RNA polymerase sigma-70 factor (sigma-E family)